MLDKRKLQYRLSRMRQAKMWQLVVVLFFAVLVTATLLRLNNLGMVERRQAVIVADEKGDQQQVRTALIELQRYVSHHMNTSLANGVYLATAYERDRDAALAAAADTGNPNSSAYQQASIECRARWQGGVESFRNDYVQCVIEKVGTLSSAENSAASINLPKADSYRYDYASPRWTPDLAGIMVVFCVIISLIILTRITTMIVLRAFLKHRFKAI